MNILVTGGGGYLGSVLIPKLLMRGHTVRVLDIGYFGFGHLGFHPEVTVVKEDLRRIIKDRSFGGELLEGCDCVIHLAAISNDPSAEIHAELTEQVNFRSTVSLAEAARQRGIRFVFSSSCSVYGDVDGELTEDDALNPLTVYAKSKMQAEQSLIGMADANWRPVILRNGTLFGYSDRMRFDLVVNIFALYSTLRNEVRVFGDGMQWRPFLSVQDCARAFIFFAEKPELRDICYNIACENLRVVDVAAIFRELNPRLQVTHMATEDPDRRNYRVSAERARAEGFVPRTHVETEAEDIVQAIMSGKMPDPESIFYRNAKWLKELTQLESNNHRHLVHLMESFSVLSRPPASQSQSRPANLRANASAV